MEYNSVKPIYIQIADSLCEDILLGRVKQGDRIPSVRDMAVQYEVNPNTVQRTFTFLQDMGIIYNQRGIGYFLAEEAYEKTLSLKRKDFLEKELLYFLKMIHLLKIGIGEIEKHYKEYTKEIIE